MERRRVTVKWNYPLSKIVSTVCDVTWIFFCYQISYFEVTWSTCLFVCFSHEDAIIKFCGHYWLVTHIIFPERCIRWFASHIPTISRHLSYNLTRFTFLLSVGCSLFAAIKLCSDDTQIPFSLSHVCPSAQQWIWSAQQTAWNTRYLSCLSVPKQLLIIFAFNLSQWKHPTCKKSFVSYTLWVYISFSDILTLSE